MDGPKLAIIGTAGRGSEDSILTHEHYTRMLKLATKVLSDICLGDPSKVRIYSGGAAWADHIAVTMTQLCMIPYENLTLFTPVPFEGFEFSGIGSSERTSNTMNHYHRKFSHKTGHRSLSEIAHVLERGSHIHVGNGNFFERNTKVAQSVGTDGTLLAFTFGSPHSSQLPMTMKEYSPYTSADVAGLKKGGTSDTWDRAVCRKLHARLGAL